MQILINFLLVLHVLTCVLMVLVVLMQRPRSEGLGAAFGGGMTENIFGAQTTTVLTRFTVWLGAAFFALTLILAVLYAKSTRQGSAVREKLMSAPAPATAVEEPVPSPVAADPSIPAESGTPAVPDSPETPTVPATPAASPVQSPIPEAAPAS